MNLKRPLLSSRLESSELIASAGPIHRLMCHRPRRGSRVCRHEQYPEDKALSIELLAAVKGNSYSGDGLSFVDLAITAIIIVRMV